MILPTWLLERMGYRMDAWLGEQRGSVWEALDQRDVVNEMSRFGSLTLPK